jgi:hypothetical protein
MAQPPLLPVAIREVVHLLILRELADLHPLHSLALKGGVNLRLHFGSPRYSEDMDLDAMDIISTQIRDRLRMLIEKREFSRRLQEFGIRGLDPGEGPNKDTETTFRYKFGVLGRGGIRYSTKVEVSFRPRHPRDGTDLGTPDARILGAYGLEPFESSHYNRASSIRQKIEALGGRPAQQARDVFDLHVLSDGHTDGTLLDDLAEAIPQDRLNLAYVRALDISFLEFKGQVTEFLDEPDRKRLLNEQVWDDMRLRVAELVERTLERKAEAP